MNMIEKFKENKKVMLIKMEQANKIAEDAANEFTDYVESLVEEASKEELKEFLNSEDEIVNDDDKLAVAIMFAEKHECVGGIAVVHIG